MNPTQLSIQLAPFWSSSLWRATWQGGLAIAAVWLLCFAFPKLPARARCWLWRLAFVKLMVCLVWTAPIELRLLPAAKAGAAAVVSGPALAGTPTPQHLQVPVQEQPAQPGTAAAPQPQAKARVLDVLLGLWLLGIMIGIVRIARQWWQARRLVLKSQACGDERMLSDVAELAQEFGISCVPEIRMADGLDAPLLAGLVNPVILAPRVFLNEKSPAQLRMMVAHELAHIKRRDLAWEWLTAVARVVFFFHPLVMVAGKENRLASEMAADEVALTVGGLERVDYAGMLVEVAARIVTPPKQELIAGIVGSHQNLKRRLQAMKHIQPRSGQRLTAVAIIIFVAGAATIVPWRVVAQSPKADTSKVDERFDKFYKVTETSNAAFVTVLRQRIATNISVDATGNCHSDGRVVEAGEITSELKNAARDPEFTVTVELDPKAPLHKVTAFLDKLDKAGIKRVTLKTASRLEPDVFNIAFGVWRPEESKQTGPAAAGREGDYWNTVGVAWSNDHTESAMKFANGEASPIQVRMVNLGGGWGNDGHLGIKSAMMDSYNYPQNNQGGNAQVTLSKVPAGMYDVYIYGHEAYPEAYGDYTLTVGDRCYGRKVTSNKSDAIENTNWVEGSQYVKFSRVEIGSDDAVNVLIKPGGQVTDHFGRTFTDATINGLQLVPVAQ